MLLRKPNIQWNQIKMVDFREYLTNHKDKVFHTITLAGVISASMAGIIWPYHRFLGIIMVVTCALCNGVLVITVMSLCCAACVEHYLDTADAKGLGRVCKELSYCCCGCCWYCYEENFKGGGETLLLNETVTKNKNGVTMGGRVSHMEKGTSQIGNGYTKLVSTEAIDDQERRLNDDQALRCALEDLTEPKPDPSFTTSPASPYHHLTISKPERENSAEDPSQAKDKMEIDPFLTAPGINKKEGKQGPSWAQRYHRSHDPGTRKVDFLKNTMENQNNTGLGLENDVIDKIGGESNPAEVQVPETKI